METLAIEDKSMTTTIQLKAGSAAVPFNKHLKLVGSKASLPPPCRNKGHTGSAIKALSLKLESKSAITALTASSWLRISNLNHLFGQARPKTSGISMQVQSMGDEDNVSLLLADAPEATELDTLGATGESTPQIDYPRIFSNLHRDNFKHEPGNLISASLLVAGTTVGAGILAIPAVTQDAGFLASAPACILCWMYMVTTGLLVAEVNVNTMCELGSGGVSLVSMAERTLGKGGVIVACVTYAFIHYAMLVAYIARSSQILATAGDVPTWAAAIAFTVALGGLCYFGSERVLGAVNGFLVFLILASFAILVALASQTVNPTLLLHADFSAVPRSIPIIALSFVYQNVVPVVSSSLEGNLPRIRTAIVVGTAIPLAMFLLWDAAILGSVPIAGSIEDPLLALSSTSGIVGPTVEFFSFFAVATSYIGFVLGLSDFLADWLKLPSGRGKNPLPFVLTVVPPAAMALINPDIFFKALDFAGTYGVLVLFGIIPGAMAWSERYSDTCLNSTMEPIVPGGKVTLVLVMASAGLVIVSNLWSNLLG